MRQSTQMSASAGGPAVGQARLRRVANAIEDGDVARACRLLDAEVRKAPTNLRLRLQLARLKEAIGDRAGAAAEYTRMLRLAPEDAAVAGAFGRVLAQGRLPSDTPFDPLGFAASLVHKTVDRDLLGAAALEYLLYDGSLTPIIGHARSHGMEAAARAALARRSSFFLRDPLLLGVLENCTVANPDVERLLTAVRRSLVLDLPRARLAEPELARFTAALAVQCWGNEYVFAAGEDELAALDLLPAIDVADAGNEDASRAHLLRALYRNPLAAFSDNVTSEALPAIKPDAFSHFLKMLLDERDSVRALSAGIPHLGAIKQTTSLAVRDQYEAHPYPRWRGTALYPDGRFSEYLESFFTKGELQFLKAPFELLVAGCGTGLQAVSAAIDYGGKAHATGLDISSTSLGYAAHMARRFDVQNLSLALGDIGETATFEPSWRARFQVIECCGVLHHMADPFAAWGRLLDCLAPGGIMLVGLYSQLARRDLAILRQQPEYPGTDASDAALRDYRHHLLSRGPDAPGARYLRARDTFTTSGFRDFFLHVNETVTSLGQIETFLDENDLAFRGFVNVPFGVLAKRFPDARWPGRLDEWAELEREQPDLFIGMYQFWTSRK